MQEGNGYDVQYPAPTTTFTSSGAYDVKVGAAPTIVDEYAQAVNDLSEKLGVLESRLSTISRPDYPNETDGVPMPEVSEARTQLQRLQHQSHRLGVILDRLEV